MILSHSRSLNNSRRTTLSEEEAENIAHPTRDMTRIAQHPAKADIKIDGKITANIF